MINPPIQDFPSPIKPNRKTRRSMQATPAAISVLGLPDDYPLTLAIEELKKIPAPRRNLLLGHLMAFLKMPADGCTLVALAVQPYLSEAQLGILVERCERQVRRYLEKLKAADIDDAIARLRRESYLDTDPKD